MFNRPTVSSELMPPRARPIKTAMCVYSGISLLEFASAYEIFCLYEDSYSPWYQTDLVSISNEPVKIMGATLEPDLTESALDDYDQIIISGWKPVEAKPSEEFSRALHKAKAQNKRIVSLCTGAFALGHINLLTDQAVTTHWRVADKFKKLFPHINLDINKLYMKSGSIYSSAGSTACIDLALDMIREDYGSERANEVARRLVVSGHRTGDQLQFVELPAPSRHNAIGHVLEWALQNLDRKINTETLASRANISRRTFDRHFKKSFGLTPKQWLGNARINHAKYLLEVSDDSLDRVAEKCGYSNANSFITAFERAVGLTPTLYRNQFKQIISR